LYQLDQQDWLFSLSLEKVMHLEPLLSLMSLFKGRIGHRQFNDLTYQSRLLHLPTEQSSIHSLK
jgi:hypothetical protein